MQKLTNRYEIIVILTTILHTRIKSVQQILTQSLHSGKSTST